ncbi:MAG: DNA primase large subunit PriL [Methanobacteriota archaeon]
MTELTTLAKYPFLQETRQYIKEYGPNVDELLTSIIYERARILGIERLEHALQRKNENPPSYATETDCIMAILSYPLARMITVCVQDTYFKRRYALGEAYQAYLHLQTEPTPFLLDIAKELQITVNQDEENQHLAVYFKDYLHHAPTRYKEWKMVNRTMHHGYIRITQKDLTRLLLEALRTRINDELDQHQCHPAIRDAFTQDIHRFQNIVALQKKKMETAPVGKLSIELLPPCMKDILAAIQAGENVPHMGRFALVAFLHTLELRNEDIYKLFSTAPDYEEDKTRYQVEHITGASSSTAYKSPGCDKMRTYGICPVEKMDDLCRVIRHPLNYYRSRWKQEKKTT